MQGALRWAGAVISFALLAWATLLAPVALISTLSQLVGWRNILSSPVGEMSRELREASSSLPFLASLGSSALTWLYLAILALFVAFDILIRIRLEARRLHRVAMNLDFGTVRAQEVRSSPEAALMSGAGGAAVAAGLGLTGPIGLAVGVGVMAAMLLVRRSALEGEARDHAARQTQEIERRRNAYVDSAVTAYIRTERRKVLLALVIVIAVVAVSYIVPFLA